MKKRLYTICGLLVFFILTICSGMIMYKFDLPPAGLVNSTITWLSPKKVIPAIFTEIQQEYLLTNVDDLITIKDVTDVTRLRNNLIRFVWGDQGLPTSLPDSIVKDFPDSLYDNISSLRGIDRLNLHMEFGIESCVYLFHPKSANHKVVLYHQGHRGDFVNGKKQINMFLDHGYTVAALSMPLLGMNNQPNVNLPRFGILHLTSHDHLKFLQPEYGHPVKFFIEPVVITINYLENVLNMSDIAMVGISGGGWTTTLTAAVDARIRSSFPVAGSYPIFLRSNSKRDWGDYEQSIPELYRIANYPELYILGASGTNRKQLQILNQFDSCCFAGIKWETYKDIIITRVQNLGAGEFDLYLDDSHDQHMISDPVMSVILAELNSGNF